jgi:CheY-like chemotaxis protein
MHPLNSYTGADPPMLQMPWKTRASNSRRAIGSAVVHSAIRVCGRVPRFKRDRTSGTQIASDRGGREMGMNLHCTILLVDDNEDDAFLVWRALAKIGFDGMFRRVSDAASARAYLEGSGPFEDRDYNPAPQLVLSDSHLGTSSGLELLQWTRQEPQLREVPFILFSSSLSPEEAQTAVANGATAYFVKPAQFEKTIEQLREIVSHMPERCRPWLKS